MKILYVITGLGLGGAEKVVADLADQMVLRGHKVAIAYLKGEILVKPQSEQIELIYLGLESVIDLFSASKKYRKLVRNYQPDIVHAHMFHANIFTRLNRIGCSIPKLICTAHNSNEGGHLRMLAYKFSNHLSNFNSNVSKEAVEAFIQSKAFTKKNLHPIYNGIDLNKFDYQTHLRNNNEQSVINLIAVGRFNQQKDYPNLLHALARVVLVCPNIHLNIAGDGELRPEIEQLIKDLSLEQYVTLLGRRNDIPNLMQQADFFILSSAYEGFGLVVAEAMACGTYVIATDCGGVKEVMGGYGSLVEPKNSQAIANALIDAISKPKEYILENNILARKYVEQNFDLQKILDQWERIYESK